MVEILSGETYFLQLPENHPIKVFCKKHKITNTKTQDALMKLINDSIVEALSGMIDQRLADFRETADTRLEAEKRIEALQNKINEEQE